MARAGAERLCDAGYYCFMLTVTAAGQPVKKKVCPPAQWPGRATTVASRAREGLQVMI